MANQIPTPTLIDPDLISESNILDKQVGSSLNNIDHDSGFEGEDGLGEQATCAPEVHASVRDDNVSTLKLRIAELEAILRQRRSQTDTTPKVPDYVLSEPTATPTAAPGHHTALLGPQIRAGNQIDIESRQGFCADSSIDLDAADGDADEYQPEKRKTIRRNTSDTAVKDAASILEFLAWGRRKDVEHHPTKQNIPASSVSTPCDQASTEEPQPENLYSEGYVLRETVGDVSSDDDGADLHQGDGSGVFNRKPRSLPVIQLLLPSPQQVHRLVHYHLESLLWYHSSFVASRFLHDLERFYTHHNGSIEDGVVDLQWVALLFAVLVGSLICAPSPMANTWGFSDSERSTLCRRWFEAALSCLDRGHYMANHSILSCQAIATMTMSAHILGFSNTQSIQLAAAVRIAQSLGLHRLGLDMDPQGALPQPPSSKAHSPLYMAMGRRVWHQLCCQDWFSIPFSDTYLVNPAHNQSHKPTNCDDGGLFSPAVPEDEPTITSFCQFLTTVAAIMPRLQDDLVSCNTAYTRYQRVLSWDAHMRRLANEKCPIFLSGAPLLSRWPKWVPWARRALAISSGHKIIMIHRSFLSESFTNPALSFTRNTCIAASKTIIKEFLVVTCEDGPVLWVHQAFSVAASIILILDILHREKPDSQQTSEHSSMVRQVIGIFRRFPNSMIAVRGTKLLCAMLDHMTQHLQEAKEFQQSKKKHAQISSGCGSFGLRATQPGLSQKNRPSPGFDVPTFIRRYCQQAKSSLAVHVAGDDHNGGEETQFATEETDDSRCTVRSPDNSSPSLHHAYTLTAQLGSPLSCNAGRELSNSAASPQRLSSSGPSIGSGNVDDIGFPPGLDISSTDFENLLLLANHDFFTQ